MVVKNHVEGDTRGVNQVKVTAIAVKDGNAFEVLHKNAAATVNSYGGDTTLELIRCIAHTAETVKEVALAVEAENGVITGKVDVATTVYRQGFQADEGFFQGRVVEWVSDIQGDVAIHVEADEAI